VLPGLAEEGKVTCGFFGLITNDLNVLPGEKDELVAGAKIEEVMEGGPAEKAGLKAEDVIVSAGGHAVENSGDLRLAMSFVKPGGTLAIEYMRDGRKDGATLTAAAAFDPEMKGAFALAALPGVKFRAGKDSLTVDSVTPEAAQRTQLAAGMEILEVNGEKAADASAVEAALHKGVNKVKTRHGDSEETLAVRVE
jgi:S1-C subfamily serine protease